MQVINAETIGTFLLGGNVDATVTIKPAPDGPTSGSIVIPTTKEQDAEITKNAFASMESHNSGDQKYNLYSNNCTDAACSVVNQPNVGLNVENSALRPRPNGWINSMKRKTELKPVRVAGMNSVTPPDATAVHAVRVPKYKVKN